MEDQTEKLDDLDAMAIVGRAFVLADRIKTVALSQPDAGAWFLMWKPVGGATVRLAKTLGKVVMSLRSWSDDREPVDDDIKSEVAEELQDIASDFPDMADVLFGMRHLDEVYAALVDDDGAREAATALSNTTLAVLDRFVDALVDIVMGERESPLTADRVVELLGRYEDIAQRLLDRWLTPS